CYSTPDGTLLPIVTRERDGFLWYVIAVPDDVNVITAAPTNNAGGVVGQIARPLVIGALG
ncbi:MAG TPA: hypothetical protein PKV27_13625, partial [Ilumatobacteraceae bacterium]|nr:hypothetical protein [Ilumatobacteraceae bacterium]